MSIDVFLGILDILYVIFFFCLLDLFQQALGLPQRLRGSQKPSISCLCLGIDNDVSFALLATYIYLWFFWFDCLFCKIFDSSKKTVLFSSSHQPLRRLSTEIMAAPLHVHSAAIFACFIFALLVLACKPVSGDDFDRRFLKTYEKNKQILVVETRKHQRNQSLIIESRKHERGNRF